MSEEFREILKARARGPEHLGPLDPELCERAMGLILAGEATPAQIGGFLLVGRAAGDSPEELVAYARGMEPFVRQLEVAPGPAPVTISGGFDGKVRTLNTGVAASLVAAAAGAQVLMIGCENTPPKLGRTVFDAMRGLGVPEMGSLDEAGVSLEEHGFAAVGTQHYLPGLHDLLGLRWEMARRTVLNVLEKILSPIRNSPFVVGVSHRPFLKSVAEALAKLGNEHALVVQAIEGSDEAPLDGTSSLVRVRPGGIQEQSVQPESLGLPRTTRAHVPWKGARDEAGRVLEALDGRQGPVRNLLVYNAALRLWTADESAPLEEHAEKARSVLDTGEALDLLARLRNPATVCS